MKEKKNFRLWLAAVALAIPSVVIAQGMPGDSPTSKDPPAADRKPDAPPADKDVKPPSADKAPDKAAMDKAAMDKAAQEKTAADMKASAEMKGAVVPMVAGIGAGEMGAAALHTLAETEYFERRDARSTARLARISVAMAQDRASRIEAMKDLSSDAQMAAKNAKKSLEEAQAAVQRIERQVGSKGGRLDRGQADKVRSEALKLHGALSSAKMSIDKVATEYHISTKLDFAEKGGEVISRE